MYSTKRTLAFLAIIGIASFSYWWWGHQEIRPSSLDASSTQHAKAGNTAATRRDNSEWARRQAARKGANDLASVTSTFKEASDCLLYYSSLREIESELSDERLDDLSNETLATLKRIDATSSRYLEIARKTETLCKGSDHDEVARVYTDAIFRAALSGNPDAETCFVMVGYRTRTLESSNSAALRASLEERYKEYATVFTQNALERGDPYVAQEALYRYIVSPTGHPSVKDNLAKANPYLTWRAARLASLRGTPEQRARLEERLALFEKQQLLQPDDIQRADSWAKAIYERDFADQPHINLDSQSPCYSSPDLAP